MTHSLDTLKHTISELIDELLGVALESQPRDNDYATNKWFDEFDCLYLTPDGTWACECKEDLNNTRSFNDTTPFYKLLIEKAIHERHDCEPDRIDDDDYAWTLRAMDPYPPEHTYEETLTLLTENFNELIDDAYNSSSDIELMCYEIAELISTSTDEDEICQQLLDLVEFVHSRECAYDMLHEFLIEINRYDDCGCSTISQSNEWIYSYRRYDNGGYTSVGSDLSAIADDIETEVNRHRKQK